MIHPTDFFTDPRLTACDIIIGFVKSGRTNVSTIMKNYFPKIVIPKKKFSRERKLTIEKSSNHTGSDVRK